MSLSCVRNLDKVVYWDHQMVSVRCYFGTGVAGEGNRFDNGECGANLEVGKMTSEEKKVTERP